MRALMILAAVLAGSALAYPLEDAALLILSPDAAFSAESDGVRIGTTDPNVSLADVRAITNRADVLALAAELDAHSHRPRESHRRAT